MSVLELRIPPAAVAFAAAGFAWFLARATPAFVISIPARSGAAIGIAIVGVATVLAGAIGFRRAGTTLSPLSPEATSTLVISGIFRYTRNPMYVGMSVLLLAWAIYLSHPLALLGVVVFVAYIHRFQIIPEESALRSLFPDSFDDYARQARRWI